MLYLLAFGASFCFVFLKAGQQLNVMRGYYWMIMPFSYGMAATETIVIFNVAKEGFGWIVVAIGTGAGLGAMLAMYLHERFLSRKKC